MNLDRVLAVGVGMAVGVAVVAGLFVLGSPGDERSRLLDARRVEDLSALTFAVRRHHAREGAVPDRIEDILGDLESDWLRDPRSGDTYGYRPLGVDSFELCATFERQAEPPHRPGMRSDEPFRYHAAGPQCFRIPASD
ncbi:MAG: hypothetical protein JJT88_15925 [Gammaproteobacteria bacterium]|nr:hypothetical protein [Gammaproteobacteria bacterium]